MSGATCASCGGKVTAQSDSRLRCRPAAQHAGCSERSMAARVLEDEFGAWLQTVVALDDKRRTRVAEIVRAKVRRGSDAAKADGSARRSSG